MNQGDASHHTDVVTKTNVAIFPWWMHGRFGDQSSPDVVDLSLKIGGQVPHPSRI